MNEYNQHDNSIVFIFGDPLHIANFLVSKGKRALMMPIMNNSKDVVNALVRAGEYDVLAQLLTSRVDANLRLDAREISYGWQIVRSAAFNNCIRLVEQTLVASGQENEREKMAEAVKSLGTIGSDLRLGAAINNFAKRQADSIELRMETPAKRRWLNGTGRYQAVCGTFLRAYGARNKLQSQRVPTLPARAKTLAW